jgi:hypothetical protein
MRLGNDPRWDSSDEYRNSGRMLLAFGCLSLTLSASIVALFAALVWFIATTVFS